MRSRAGGEPGSRARPSYQPRRCFVLAVAVLLAVTAARALGVAGPDDVWVPLMTVLLVLIAWWCGMTSADLGLRRADIAAGVRYGGAAFALVLLVLGTAAVLPLTSVALRDARGDISAGRLVDELVVTVVLLTAVPEEFAFRGVLLGSGILLWGRSRSVLVVSALFGLWHVQPTLATMAGNPAVNGLSASGWGRLVVVLGAVAATFLAGLVFAWLRLRSGSLVAAVIAHVATNGLGLAVAWVVVHAARTG